MLDECRRWLDKFKLLSVVASLSPTKTQFSVTIFNPNQISVRFLSSPNSTQLQNLISDFNLLFALQQLSSTPLNFPIFLQLSAKLGFSISLPSLCSFIIHQGDDALQTSKFLISRLSFYADDEEPLIRCRMSCRTGRRGKVESASMEKFQAAN